MTEARDKAKAWLDNQEKRRMAEIEEQIRLARPVDGFEPWENPIDEREVTFLVWLIVWGIVAFMFGTIWWAILWAR